LAGGGSFRSADLSNNGGGGPNPLIGSGNKYGAAYPKFGE